MKVLSNFLCLNTLIVLLVVSGLLQYIVIYYYANKYSKKPTATKITKQEYVKIRNSYAESSLTNLSTDIFHNRTPGNVAGCLNKSCFIPFQHTDYVIPILLIACNRLLVNQTIEQLLSYRRLIDKGSKLFPIYVSQGCDSNFVANLIDNYSDNVIYLQNTFFVPPSVPSSAKGYSMISLHYKWALDQIFVVRNNSLTIVVEDDLEISLDFYEYFAALAPILLNDPTLYCISGWNDNGKATLVDVTRSDLLYRSDFFPGLGWMLTQNLWKELSPKWPIAYWDEFMRHPENRLGRACIRPEISRLHTFGSSGVSGGQFFYTHLQFNYLNPSPIKFESAQLLATLKPDVYDAEFRQRVYYNTILVTMDNMTQMTRKHAYRFEYDSTYEFLHLASIFGIMDDLKYGVPRTAYLGVVTIFNKGIRIYLAPPRDWKQYDLS